MRIMAKYDFKIVATWEPKKGSRTRWHISAGRERRTYENNCLLLFDLNLPHHSALSVSQLGVCYGHFTLQHIMPRHKLLSQPHHSPDVMTVERAAQGLRRGGTALMLLPPAF